MIWDRIGKAIAEAAAADSLLQSIFDDAVRWESPSDLLRVPCLDISLVAHGSPTELWDPMVFQFDIWALSLPDVARAERRLWVLFHSDLPIQIGGVTTWAWSLGGERLAQPDRNDYFGKAIRFQLTPLREQYAPTA